MQDNQRNNLDKALGLFIEAMRLFIPIEMEKEYGKQWDQEYYECLSEKQQRDWDNQVRSGKGAEQMIDFHNLGIFAIRQKEFLRKFFGYQEANNLPSKFNEIANARNMLAHYDDWDHDRADLAFAHMIGIAKSLEMSELEDEIRNLKDDISVEKQIAETKEKSDVTPNNTAWFNNVKPHLDIRQGNLDESVFAADLAEVALGTGREVYSNQTLFFDKTYFTEGLTNIANRVVKGLNGQEDGENRVISLQTGFGGGKTHTLISLYHLVKAGNGIASNKKVSEKLSTLPQFKKANIAVFTNTTNDPTQGRKADGLQIKTLWGELAYQLGGAELYEKIRPNDEARTAPKGLFLEILEEASPSLILIDELADYCVAASGASVGSSTLSDQTISFMQELTESVAKVKNCVLVVTLPASVSEVANSPQAMAILNSLESRVKRVGADTKPVAEEEIFEVIRHRLFEGFGDQETTDGVLAAYSNMYHSLWLELPARSDRTEYARLMKRAYPFHPELINIFKNKWASNPQFQRTRGVLRLMASIVSDLWKRRNNLSGNHTLIHPSHLDLENLDTLVGEVKKLYGNGYDAVISSDVSGTHSNACQIDEEKPEFGAYNLTQGISTTIFLNTFGSSGQNKGITIKELKLQLLMPDSFNHNSINSSLDELQNKAYYLYYSPAGGSEQRFWYHTKPNLNILVNNALSDIRDGRIESDIVQRIEDRVGRVTKFRVIANPQGDIPEQKSPTLIVLHPSIYHNGNRGFEKTIKEIALKKGNSNRLYRNTMLFLSISQHGKFAVYNSIREYLACHKIQDEYKTTLEADQKAELKIRTDEANQKVQKELVTAYNQVHKYVASDGIRTIELRQFSDSFDRQLSNNLFEKLKEEEWLLESVGFNTLKKNNLIPEEGNPLQASEILEAFLRYDDKPMIFNKSAIQDSLTKYCYNKLFAIASRSYDGWTQMFYGVALPMFDVVDETYWLVVPSEYEAWKKIQEESTSPPTVEPEEDKPSGVDEPTSETTKEHESTIRQFSRITVSGKANAVGFNQLFSSFIMPLKENGVEIEFKIIAKSKENYPLTENSQQYKIAKESARQLGYDFDEE